MTFISVSGCFMLCLTLAILHVQLGSIPIVKPHPISHMLHAILLPAQRMHNAHLHRSISCHQQQSPLGPLMANAATTGDTPCWPVSREMKSSSCPAPYQDPPNFWHGNQPTRGALKPSWKFWCYRLSHFWVISKQTHEENYIQMTYARKIDISFVNVFVVWLNEMCRSIYVGLFLSLFVSVSVRREWM